jgi:hypothetical protein
MAVSWSDRSEANQVRNIRRARLAVVVGLLAPVAYVVGWVLFVRVPASGIPSDAAWEFEAERMGIYGTALMALWFVGAVELVGAVLAGASHALPRRWVLALAGSLTLIGFPLRTAQQPSWSFAQRSSKVRTRGFCRAVVRGSGGRSG